MRRKFDRSQLRKLDKKIALIIGIILINFIVIIFVLPYEFWMGLIGIIFMTIGYLLIRSCRKERRKSCRK